MSYQDQTDEELMQAFQQGESLAFEVLLMRHKKGVSNFLFYLLKGRENTDEAFQEVFERVLRSAQSYRPEARFTTWVYTIARNYCIDMYRKQRIRRGGYLNDYYKDEGDGHSHWEEKIADDQPKTFELVGAKDLTEKLERALAAINPDQKEVFLMREKAGLQFDEIAEVMGVSVNTVKSRMRYALASLQDEFKKMGIVR